MKATLEFGDEETADFRMATRATEAHRAAAEADRLARYALKYSCEEDPAARADKYAATLEAIRDALARTVAGYEGEE